MQPIDLYYIMFTLHAIDITVNLVHLMYSYFVPRIIQNITNYSEEYSTSELKFENESLKSIKIESNSEFDAYEGFRKPHSPLRDELV